MPLPASGSCSLPVLREAGELFALILTGENTAALVGAGIWSVLLFPLLALTLRERKS